MTLYLGNNLISGVAYPTEPTRNLGQIIESIVPLTDAGLHLLDGTLINGAGIYSDFVTKIGEIYSTQPKYSNVTKVGLLTDTDGVLSGFSTSNFAKFPSDFQPSTNTWEIVFKVTTGNSVSGQQYIACFNKGLTNTDRYGTRIYVNGGKFHFTVTYNGNAWDIPDETAIGTYSVQTNTTYYIKFQYTGSAYTLSYSIDGDTYIQDINIASTTPSYNSPTACLIGIWNNGSYTSPWLGSIDLNESYININGSRWWSGRIASGFTEESVWQSSVSTYGVCGKFVYDSVANTVRLPKITGKLDGTTDVTALGELAEQYVKLPNITGTLNVFTSQGTQQNGALSKSIASQRNPGSGGELGWGTLSLDASRSSSVYSGNGSDTKIHEQAIKVLYYIVLATTTKTEIEVDIDEITTDLNGKADVDLSNCTKPHIVETYVNGTSWYNMYSNGWCEQGGYTTTDGGSVALLVSFIDTNYTITTCPITNGSAGVSGVGVGNKQVGSFTLWRGGSPIAGTSWQASGYIS